jgi:cyanate permease
MLGIWGGQALGTFLVSYAVESGVGEGAAGLLLTISSLAGITARIGAGWTVDRRRSSGLGELRLMLLAGALGLALLSTGVPALVWLGAVCAFAGGWGWTGVLNYVVVRAYPGAPASATGVAQAGVYIGATIGVPLFGQLVEATTYSTAWLATALSGVIAVLIMSLVERRLARWALPPD